MEEVDKFHIAGVDGALRLVDDNADILLKDGVNEGEGGLMEGQSYAAHQQAARRQPGNQLELEGPGRSRLDSGPRRGLSACCRGRRRCASGCLGPGCRGGGGACRPGGPQPGGDSLPGLGKDGGVGQFPGKTGEEKSNGGQGVEPDAVPLLQRQHVLLYLEI